MGPMAWTLFLVPSTKRPDLDQVLKDDQLSRQSQKIRDAGTAGGPSGELYVLLEGGSEAMGRADSLLGPLGKKLTGTDGETVYRKLKDEEESASAGMGLFFTE
jgi:hypothetical protein